MQIGGRLFSVVVKGKDVLEARQIAYSAIAYISVLKEITCITGLILAGEMLRGSCGNLRFDYNKIYNNNNS